MIILRKQIAVLHENVTTVIIATYFPLWFPTIVMLCSHTMVLPSLFYSMK